MEPQKKMRFGRRKKETVLPVDCFKLKTSVDFVAVGSIQESCRVRRRSNKEKDI